MKLFIISDHEAAIGTTEQQARTCLLTCLIAWFICDIIRMTLTCILIAAHTLFHRLNPWYGVIQVNRC